MENRISWLGHPSGTAISPPANIIYNVNGEARELSIVQLTMVESELQADPLSQLMTWGNFKTPAEALAYLENANNKPII
jgi:hypothetical protein